MPSDTAAEHLLLSNIKQRMPELETLLERAQSHWEYEAIEYGRKLDAPPQTLPSGWAAVLYLYDLR
ncbi:MAG: hypothetical protein ACXW31_08470 [Thermoanaerobaculia bacterium]